MKKLIISLQIIVSFFLLTELLKAETVRVAVAANFTAAMKEIEKQFQHQTGIRLKVSYGSTGKLFSHIINGAPYDVFLAADQKRPELLEERKLASQRFTYAIGKLVLWSHQKNQQVDKHVLTQDNIKKISVANAKTAPYGVAALEVLNNLGLYQQLKTKLVSGDSIAQTYQFVATGNAQLGFIALAQIALNQQKNYWLIDENLYSPIRQDAVLLKRADNNPDAGMLIEYLKSDAAKQIIHKYGYSTVNYSDGN